MDSSQIINDIKCDIECMICYEKFINLTSEQYNIFYENNKHILPDTFDDECSCRCYEDRFECLTCKNIICMKCYWSFKNHKFKPKEHLIEYYEEFGNLDDEGLVEGCPGEDCPIICPFCLTKDYKIFYGNQIPYEVLNDIRNYTFNS